MSVYSARIRAARAYKGLTQLQLADELGVDEQTIKRREKDSDSARPKKGERRAIAAICGVPVEFMEHGFSSALLAELTPESLTSYQSAIAKAIGGWPHHHSIDRVRQEFTARVVAEPSNAYDPNAVRVTSLDGATLAYFSRPEAARYARLFAAINETCDFEVPAIVAARWIGTRWNGGVWLDLPSPDEIVAGIREHGIVP